MVKINVAKSLDEAIELIQAGNDTTIDIHSHAEIGDEGAEKIAECLRETNVVEVLILGGQRISPAGAVLLGAALCQNTILRELHLHNNNLGYEGVKKLALELAQPWTKGGNRPGNKHLQLLGLQNNNIGPHCGDCGLCRASPGFPIELLDLSSLRIIDLNGNQIQQLPHEFCDMPNLVGLDIRGNPIENIPKEVFMTAKEGHQAGWPVLKEYLHKELDKGTQGAAK
mmetsp:Transcript_35711/g.87846  ORF Transcript_35711/g.87846 Transcript_35711/m.87846 type:complete len:226 (-) Transcript_35711:207-884(-)